MKRLLAFLLIAGTLTYYNVFAQRADEIPYRYAVFVSGAAGASKYVNCNIDGDFTNTDGNNFIPHTIMFFMNQQDGFLAVRDITVWSFWSTTNGTPISTRAEYIAAGAAGVLDSTGTVVMQSRTCKGLDTLGGKFERVFKNEIAMTPFFYITVDNNWLIQATIMGTRLVSDSEKEDYDDVIPLIR